LGPGVDEKDGSAGWSQSFQVFRGFVRFVRFVVGISGRDRHRLKLKRRRSTANNIPRGLPE
jgi:hypothetical protein